MRDRERPGPSENQANERFALKHSFEWLHSSISLADARFRTNLYSVLSFFRLEIIEWSLSTISNKSPGTSEIS